MLYVTLVVLVVVATVDVEAISCMPVADGDLSFCAGYRGSGRGTDRFRVPSQNLTPANMDTASKLKYNELTAAGAKFASASAACLETVKAFACLKFLPPCIASGNFLRDGKICDSQIALLATYCGAGTSLDDVGYTSTDKSYYVASAQQCPLASWSPPSAPAASTTTTPTATPTPTAAATATATATATAPATATPSVPASPSGSPAGSPSGSPSGSASPSPTQNSINGATSTAVTTLSVLAMGILGLCTAVLSM
eukprot:TRINITY_DN792_c0_g1_i3.p1 TRINITY_DN792_c0_g1~~TRINITY_DN792_c0_g1_i3.p1  ORF type:complete len:254 (+),score=22.31 TRINITY_DN792_c0_g1_i3:1133-1894(+)